MTFSIVATGFLAACATDDNPTAPPRLVPSAPHRTSVLVTSNSYDGPGSLRAAVLAAQDGDVIQLSSSLQGAIIPISTDPLSISHSITIVGPTDGVRVELLGSIPCEQGVASCTPNAVVISPTATVTIRNLKIVGGTGRGISNSGTLTVENTTISGSVSYGGAGAGIVNSGTLVLVNSSIWGNTGYSLSESGSGGGTGGTLTPADGAGLAQLGINPSTTLIHSTIVGNTASGTGGGIYIANGTLTLRNSIIAANTAATLANCFIGGSATATLLGTSLSSDDTCGAPGSGLFVAPTFGTTYSIDALTGGVDLTADSPAINAAPDCPVATDQRLVSRPQPVGGACDIGAYEFDLWKLVSVSAAATGTVDSKTGVALVNGTVTCSEPLAIVLDVALTETQKSGKVNVDVQATASVPVNCSATPTPWITFLTPVNGAFKNGSATVSVTVHDPDPTVIVSGGTSSVKLFWSK